MLRLRWPSGERNLDRKELRFRLAGEVEALGGGMEDMAHGRSLLHPRRRQGRRYRKRGSGTSPVAGTSTGNLWATQYGGGTGWDAVGQIPPRRRRLPGES